MPELPEVEVTRLGLQQSAAGATIDSCRVYQRQLRKPVSRGFAAAMAGNRIDSWRRRGKYLIATLARGQMLVHLGMSGRMIHREGGKRERHDHILWTLANGRTLAFNDARRFGCVLWSRDAQFPQLEGLGCEPLAAGFGGARLRALLGNSERSIKACLMDQRLIAGLGNIYVNEALFGAAIHPLRPARSLTAGECAQLSAAIRRVLRRALKAGGTTLRDFARPDGEAGYFALSLDVYGRQGQPCPRCATPIESLVIGQRSSFVCPRCQPSRSRRGPRR